MSFASGVPFFDELTGTVADDLLSAALLSTALLSTATPCTI